MSIIQEYKQSLKMIEVEEPLDLYFYRIVSFIFVKIIYPLPITPNQLSVVALLMGIISGVFFAFGTVQSFFAAGVLYALYYLFDLSDGQVARLKKNGTRLGRIIDGIADYVTHIAIYFGLIIGWANTTADILIVAGALASLLVHVMLFDYYRNRYLGYAQGGVSLYGDDLAEFREEYTQLKNEGGRYLSRFIIYVYLKYLNFQQMFVSSQKSEQIFEKYDLDNFLKRNRPVIRFWSYMGSSLHISLLIVLALINRIDIYLYSIIFVINAYALFMFILQMIVDKKTSLKME